MQKKIILSLLLASYFILYTPYSILASSLTPSPLASPTSSAKALATADPSPASIDEVTDNLKKRLQDSLGDAKSDLPQSSLRAYIGVVKDVIKDTIIVEDKDGKRDIKLSDKTTILRSPGNAVIKSDSIRIDDYIIAIGYPSEDGILDGRRLIVSATAIKSPAKMSGHGTIKSIVKDVLTLDHNGEETKLVLSKKTILKSPVGAIESSDLEAGDTIVYTSLIDEETNTATIIMRTNTSAVE